MPETKFSKKQSMSDKDTLKLKGILEAISKIEKCTKSYKKADDFFDATIPFDAAMMNFVVIGEMVDKLSKDFREKNKQIDWIKIKDFRNLIAHDYFGIDAEEVWQISKTHIPELKQEIEKLL